MIDNVVPPNVRTYTALMTGLATAQQWERAFRLLRRMGCNRNSDVPAVKPNAYTYAALVKGLGECGEWQLAEAVFQYLEAAELCVPVDKELFSMLRSSGQVAELAEADISGHSASTNIEEKLAALAV